MPGTDQVEAGQAGKIEERIVVVHPSWHRAAGFSASAVRLRRR
jgi:hypothetical protein